MNGKICYRNKKGREITTKMSSLPKTCQYCDFVYANEDFISWNNAAESSGIFSSGFYLRSILCKAKPCTIGYDDPPLRLLAEEKPEYCPLYEGPIDPPETEISKSEPLYQVYLDENGDCIIAGITDRDTAEGEHPIKHLTVIVVAFIKDGDDHGKVLVHDRTEKLLAKKKKKEKIKLASYNLCPAGHVTADTTDQNCIGKIVPKELLYLAAIRECQEEVLFVNNTNGENPIQVLKDGFLCTEKYVIKADPYRIENQDLIPLGYVTFDGESNNTEISFLFALPLIPSKDVPLRLLITADNVDIDDEQTRNIYLPPKFFSLEELLLMNQNPEIEICDAITRLWLPENKSVYDRLLAVIKAETR